MNDILPVSAGPADIAPNEDHDRCDEDDHSDPVECILSLKDNVTALEQFKDLMWTAQALRRRIVVAILQLKLIEHSWILALDHSHNLLAIDQIDFRKRILTSPNISSFFNIKDELFGLKKDLRNICDIYLQMYLRELERLEKVDGVQRIDSVDLTAILAPFHPVSVEEFIRERNICKQFLEVFIRVGTNGRKPIMITDWDGTMKDYCSQYATNLQPVYSAVDLVRFAERFTRLSAVLTAGPLRGPGILDLTAIPLRGPILFSGSWGREWWLHGRRVVHNDGISDEGFDALNRFNDEMSTLLHQPDYSQFALVGSGVQRKVDRVTLGVQTVCGHVTPELKERYEEEVKERIHRVDPYKRILVFDPSTHLEIEIVAHSDDGTVWNKADGMEKVIASQNDRLEDDGAVLICGDTFSDFPMVENAARKNPHGVMALFVGAGVQLREQIRNIISDEQRRCFISCPDVIHAAMALMLAEANQK